MKTDTWRKKIVQLIKRNRAERRFESVYGRKVEDYVIEYADRETYYSIISDLNL